MRMLMFAITLLAAAASAAGDNTRLEARLGEAMFTAIERELIAEYFRQHPAPRASKTTQRAGKQKGAGKSKQAPPGLAGRSELPPGLARQLERNGTLPPGLQGRGLPADLVARLPLRKPGQQRIVVDQDVLLIELATGLILDLIRGAAGQ